MPGRSMRMVRRAVPFLIAVVLVAGCGSSDGGDTPVACLAPAATYLTALEAAPEPVRLAGETPISGCLVDDQSTGDLADVGASLVRAATLLSAAAQRDPGGPQTLRLGYLVGAVQEGASETSGIHADLVRRIAASYQYLEPRGTSSFDLAYAEGYAAGRSDG
ncbi:MAG: hypothetical protein AABM66_03965 [Actinomycetota bacterium]